MYVSSLSLTLCLSVRSVGNGSFVASGRYLGSRFFFSFFEQVQMSQVRRAQQKHHPTREAHHLIPRLGPCMFGAASGQRVEGVSLYPHQEIRRTRPPHRPARARPHRRKGVLCDCYLHSPGTFRRPFVGAWWCLFALYGGYEHVTHGAPDSAESWF